MADGDLSPLPRSADSRTSVSPPPADVPVGAPAIPANDLPEVAQPSEATALGDLGSHLRLWVVVACGLSLDLWSKSQVFATLGQGGNHVLIPNVLEFHTTLNPGALFGIGAGKTGLFLVASALALLLVIWMFAQSGRRQWLTHVALGAILAGALGNMYDRIFVKLVPFRDPATRAPAYYVPAPSRDGELVELHKYAPRGRVEVVRVPAGDEGVNLPRPIGYVRDFIKIPTRWLGRREIWPWVFNVADMLLVGGVGVLALRMLRERRSVGSAALDATAVES